jgi:hypothetical protein
VVAGNVVGPVRRAALRACRRPRVDRRNTGSKELVSQAACGIECGTGRPWIRQPQAKPRRVCRSSVPVRGTFGTECWSICWSFWPLVLTVSRKTGRFQPQWGSSRGTRIATSTGMADALSVELPRKSPGFAGLLRRTSGCYPYFGPYIGGGKGLFRRFPFGSALRPEALQQFPATRLSRRR